MIDTAPNKSRFKIPNAEKKHRLLVCDDEMLVRDFLTEQLRDEGYDVDEAKDGIECLSLIEKHRPDALLLDLRMPNMDGMTVIRKMREMGVTIPILVISSHEDLGQQMEIDELQVGAFIPKPFDPSEVSALVQAALLEVADAQRTKKKRPTLT